MFSNYLNSPDSTIPVTFYVEVCDLVGVLDKLFVVYIYNLEISRNILKI